MQRWNIVSKQTRQVVGEIEAEQRSEANARLVEQHEGNARYYELSLATREKREPLEDLELTPSQVAEVLRRWAVTEKGFPETVQVRVLVNGDYLDRADLMYLTFVAAVVHDPTAGVEPDLEVMDDEAEDGASDGTTTEQTL